MGDIVVNKCLFDQFTLVHFGAGVAAHHCGWTLCQTLLAGFAWDFAIEPTVKASHPELFPYPSQDSPSHALIDALTPAVGWLVASWWKGRMK